MIIAWRGSLGRSGALLISPIVALYAARIAGGRLADMLGQRRSTQRQRRHQAGKVSGRFSKDSRTWNNHS